MMKAALMSLSYSCTLCYMSTAETRSHQPTSEGGDPLPRDHLSARKGCSTIRLPPGAKARQVPPYTRPWLSQVLVTLILPEVLEKGV